MFNCRHDLCKARRVPRKPLFFSYARAYMRRNDYWLSASQTTSTV